MARVGRPKGYPKSGGRKPGTPNRLPGYQAAKRLLPQIELPHVRLEDMDPLSVIHAIMQIRWYVGDYAGALVAATALAPYTNARLSSSEVKITHELASLSDEELHRQALAYEQKLAARGPIIDGEAAH